jgi:hypothetical protein
MGHLRCYMPGNGTLTGFASCLEPLQWDIAGVGGASAATTGLRAG